MIKICKYNLLLVFLLFFSSLDAQSLYDIKGNPVSIGEGKSLVMILYDEGYCSACTKTLLEYIPKICEKTDFQTIVMISTPYRDIVSLRSTTSSVQSYMEKKDAFPIVYDLNPIEKQKYRKKYKVKLFPCIVMLPANGKKTLFIPYAELFAGEYAISPKALRKIADYTGSEIQFSFFE